MTFRLDLDSSYRRRAIRALTAINLLLTATTAAFIYAWASMDGYSETARSFIRYVLVQGHLATENVVAAWYSSMLLLSVALAGAAAHVADGRRGAGWLRHGWLAMGLAFLTLSVDEIGSLHERVGMVAALGGSAGQPMGWIYVLAAPIAAVAMFLVAFGWFHVRAVPSAFRQMALGIALFAANPFFERVEMMLLHGGAAHGTWQRLWHDVLLVVEEGALELFGTLCFASGAAAYLAGITGGSIDWRISTTRATAGIALCTALLAAGVPISIAIVSHLPAGDTGIAANWFPACAFFLLAVACLLRRPGGGSLRLLGAFALVPSAYFGAGIYGYTNWGIDAFGPVIPMSGTIAAGAAAIVLMRAES